MHISNYQHTLTSKRIQPICPAELFPLALHVTSDRSPPLIGAGLLEIPTDINWASPVPTWFSSMEIDANAMEISWKCMDMHGHALKCIEMH